MSRKNELGSESSLYLQQHAQNPVHWQAWSDTVWESARAENKAVIVSIGYSSCHWCHVMEHECFEDPEVAALMNEHFICIKVDREERPDVDHVYMDALQLMTGGGGWPMNCFCLPNGRPFYGCTYLPRQRWMAALEAINKVWQTEQERILVSATETHNYLRDSIAVSDDSTALPDLKLLIDAIQSWTTQFDTRYGGECRAPKFPVPINLSTLLETSVFLERRDDAPMHERNLLLSKQLREHVMRTALAMCRGGIYDQLAGGFARYSTDVRWKLPHFEKMLYDNAQLITLLAELLRIEDNAEIRTSLVDTLSWIDSHMLRDNYCCSASIDADSEGEEGRYYLWSHEELRKVLGDDFELAKDLFCVGDDEILDDGRFVLMQAHDLDVVAEKHNTTPNQLLELREQLRQKLLHVREQRPKPVRDDKLIVSWNALMINAWVQCYWTLGDRVYLQRAITCAEQINTHARLPDGKLMHLVPNQYDARDSIAVPAFLDDYACLIQAFVHLSAVSSDSRWRDRADELLSIVQSDFRLEQTALFSYKSTRDAALFIPTIERYDTVVPSSNAMMCHVLWDMGSRRQDPALLQQSKLMLSQNITQVLRAPSSSALWLRSALAHSTHSYNCQIRGPKSFDAARSLVLAHHPYCTVDWSDTQTEDLSSAPSPEIQVCDESSCFLTTHTIVDVSAAMRY